MPLKSAGRPRLSTLAMACAFSALPALPFFLGLALPAVAAECSDDIGNMTKKRQSIIDDLNRLAKSSPKGQLDPAVSCPKLRNLAAAEQELLAYLQKNKDWCMVPDEAITNLTMSHDRSKSVAARACAVAEQMKKNEEAGGLGGAQKLPTGPL
ncbi:MAG TPA: hypothetical protein VKA03_06750 [Methylovirgula sp.]|nr:hypothetical protein [Methylovirgula sp.]